MRSAAPPRRDAQLMPVRIGVVGTGSWARRVHLPALRAHPSVHLVGVWGRDPNATAQAAGTGFTTAYQRYADLLSDVEAIALALPPAVQPAFAEDAARAGVHLLLEKPLSESAPAAGGLIQAIDAADIAAIVCLPRFFDPLHKAWLDGVRADHPSIGHVTWRNGALLPGSTLASGWRESSGALMDVGPHILSQLAYVLGQIVRADVSEDPHRALGLAMQHEGGGRSFAEIDLRDADRVQESYTFTEGEIIFRRDIPIEFGIAYSRILDDFVDRIRAHRRTDAPWSPHASAEAAEILGALRDTGRWAATVEAKR